LYDALKVEMDERKTDYLRVQKDMERFDKDQKKQAKATADAEIARKQRVIDEAKKL